MDATQAALKDIEATADLLEKGLKLAGLVTRLFAEAGCNLVVVGGSAVEFYTEGAYMSGDIDFCRRDLARIPLRRAQDIMALLAACVSGETSVDWEEVNRLAALPEFNVSVELDELREEVQRELAG